MTLAQKHAIETAAAYEGRSLTDFTTSVITERAAEVIHRERQLRVDAESFAAFNELFDRPAQTIDGLRDLLSRKSVFID